MTRKRNSEKDLVVSSGAAAPRPRRSPTARPKHSQTTADLSAPIAREPEAEAPLAASGPAHDEIARLAYSYWLDRGCEGGSPDEDWSRAEQELRKQAAIAISATA